MARDTIYSSTLASIPDFTFGERVVEVFDDMIARSVPLYRETCTMSVALAASFAQKGTNIYDLGCSTGTLLLALSERPEVADVELIGIDNSEPMIREARRRQDVRAGSSTLRFELADILEYPISNASVLSCNYTLQFLAPAVRRALLARLYQSLVSGGLLLLTEKVRHPHAKLQTVLTDLHHDFKRAQGYSELEIAQKREAIEDVLIPLTSEENSSMLREAGFSVVYPVLSWYTFVSFAAVRVD